jgi:beta-glucanase (GH16 family)
LRIEARIKMPVKQGHWGGFWSLGTQGVWPASGEIDIAEHANKDPFYYATTHYASPTGLHVQQPLPPVNQVPVTNPAGWNVYRVDWSCDSIIWSLNGEQRSRLNKAQAANWVFDKPFKLILNLAVGGDLPGNDADPAGGEMLVDWVKVTAPPGTQVPTQGW